MLSEMANIGYLYQTSPSGFESALFTCVFFLSEMLACKHFRHLLYCNIQHIFNVYPYTPGKLSQVPPRRYRLNT